MYPSDKLLRGFPINTQSYSDPQNRKSASKNLFLDSSRDDFAKALHHDASLVLILGYWVKDQVSAAGVNESLDLVAAIVGVP